MADSNHVFVWHSDPEHAWLEVDWTALRSVSLNPWDFSRYSYRNGNVFYLEEDCDASKFIKAWMDKHGAAPATAESKPSESSSFIRTLQGIREIR